MKKVALVVLLAVSAWPGLAKDPEAQTPAPEKKICKDEPGTGSILPKRVCRTKAEWQAITRQSREEISRSRDQRPATNMKNF